MRSVNLIKQECIALTSRCEVLGAKGAAVLILESTGACAGGGICRVLMSCGRGVFGPRRIGPECEGAECGSGVTFTRLGRMYSHTPKVY